MNSTPASPLSGLDETTIRQWLISHPQFLQQNLDLFQIIAPPLVQHGGNVVDFQHHLLGQLQDNLRQMKERYEGLIVASRDNMSTQTQVHQAVLGIIRAANLDHLLQMLTQDLLRLFDVDMVRLAIESPLAEYYAAQESEQQEPSGFTFITPDQVDIILGKGQDVRLIADLQAEMSAALHELFADSLGLIRSCILLRMALPHNNRSAILVFGVRHENRFHPQQGVDLLQFLAQIVEYKLDSCLSREGLEEV
jgi:uncharacterized protein YigA (DUF484 family)